MEAEVEQLLSRLKTRKRLVLIAGGVISVLIVLVAVAASVTSRKAGERLNKCFKRSINILELTYGLNI